MSNLENTPWILHRVSDTRTYNVLDSKEYFISEYLDEPTAKAIAALPETLAELEALKAERDELKAFVKKIASGNYFRKDVYEEAKELLKD